MYDQIQEELDIQHGATASNRTMQKIAMEKNEFESGIRQLIVDGEKVYVRPVVGATKLFIYSDAECTQVVKDANNNSKMISVKEFYGMDKWQ